MEKIIKMVNGSKISFSRGSEPLTSLQAVESEMTSARKEFEKRTQYYGYEVSRLEDGSYADRSVCSRWSLFKEAYNSGLESAAKVCDDKYVEWKDYGDVANDCAEAIRKLKEQL